MIPAHAPLPPLRPLLAIALLLLATGLLAGCWSSRTSEASVERTTGIQAGQAVDLTTVRRAQAEATGAIDIGPVVQAAVAAATGDLRQAVQAVSSTLSAAPKPATPDEIAALLQRSAEGAGLDPRAAGALGGLGGIALLALREALAHRRTRQDSDEAWAEIKRRATTPAGII